MKKKIVIVSVLVLIVAVSCAIGTGALYSAGASLESMGAITSPALDPVARLLKASDDLLRQMGDRIANGYTTEDGEYLSPGPYGEAVHDLLGIKHNNISNDTLRRYVITHTPYAQNEQRWDMLPQAVADASVYLSKNATLYVSVYFAHGCSAQEHERTAAAGVCGVCYNSGFFPVLFATAHKKLASAWQTQMIYDRSEGYWYERAGANGGILPALGNGTRTWTELQAEMKAEWVRIPVPSGK